MLELSERILRELTDITKTENELLPKWVDKKFVAKCIIPPLSENNQVHCNIAVVAPVAAGKSTLFNSLCGYPILPVASNVTSSVPTYINRTKEQSKENVAVYGIKREVVDKDGLSFTTFERDETTKRNYYANDISKEMFQELFDYMYFVIHGTDLEYRTTIENVAYFMKTVEKNDVLFNGDDSQKRTITKQDFALTYANPRHRLMLLLVLLCVYVNQNDSESGMSVYTKEVNIERRRLLKKYGFPAKGDYCVCLDWCSDDIPENVTLIDLPGTGAATQDTDMQSSHTALVRGILTEADAIWVLCSDNGVVDPDLLYALKDVMEGNTRKNKVCIYNCRNRRPNDSGPVTDFLKKIPCLTGERCFVVDALAGEYKYIQNGVNALMTKTASDIRSNDFRTPAEDEIVQRLEFMYSSEKRAYCTFITNQDVQGNIVAVQDSSLRYTLDSFFKNALADYIERLKYEVTLSQAIEQAKFYIYIRDSLSSSLGILKSIDGKGEVVSNAVNEALSAAREQAFNNYQALTVKYATELDKGLQSLSKNIYVKIRKEFSFCLNSVIESVRNVWRSLEREGDPNCLNKNFWGNYSLKYNNPNWQKFLNVCALAEDKITVSAFDRAMNVADSEIKKYNELLDNYVNNLKKITQDFANDYVNAFLCSYDKKRDELCGEKRDGVAGEVYQSFNSTRENLKKELLKRLNAVCTMVCDSFDILTDHNGIFDTLCQETDQAFRDCFCENILDDIRSFLNETYKETHRVGFIRDSLSPDDLHRILQDNFLQKRDDWNEKLSKQVNQFYGVSGEDINFPGNLSHRLNAFNGEKIAKGAVPEIKNMHSNISSLVSFGSDMAVDLKTQIKEIGQAIATWAGIGAKYVNLHNGLEKSDAENTKKLYEDYEEQIKNIRAKTEK